MPYGEFSPIRLEASLVAPRPSAAVPAGFDAEPTFLSCLALGPGVSVRGFTTGPWLSTVYHPRTCNRYYGLIRQSDELRSVWASSAYSGRVFAVAGRPPHSPKPVNWTLLF